MKLTTKTKTIIMATTQILRVDKSCVSVSKHFACKKQRQRRQQKTTIEGRVRRSCNSRLKTPCEYDSWSLEQLYDKFYFPYCQPEYVKKMKQQRCMKLSIAMIGGKEEIVICGSMGVFENDDGSFCCINHYEGNAQKVEFSCLHDNCYKVASYGPPFSCMLSFRCVKHRLPTDTSKNLQICQHSGCSTMASYGHKAKEPRFCNTHRETGMNYVLRRYCIVDSCTNRARYRVFRSKYNIYCEEHKTADSFRHCRAGKTVPKSCTLEEIHDDHQEFIEENTTSKSTTQIEELRSN